MTLQQQMNTYQRSLVRFVLIMLTLTALMVNTNKVVAQPPISVERFTKLDNDLTARIAAPVRDRNNDLTALLKMVTNATGFDFDGGSIGIEKIEYKVGEVWVYIPEGSRAITIAHPQFKLLRNYTYPMPIEAGAVYEMVLAHGELITVVKEQPLLSEFVVIDSEPSGADLYLNGTAVGKTPFVAEKPEGSYEWRIEQELYKSVSGQFNLKAGDKVEFKEVLKPNFGSINLSSKPENGANISINGVDTRMQTPSVIDRLPVGTHTITLRHEWYETKQIQVQITAESHENESVTLVPTYAMLTVQSDSDAHIFINGGDLGKGRWEGRVKPGVCTIEVQKPRHRSEEKRIVLKPGDQVVESLTPQPVFGILRVLSEPLGAEVYLNGGKKGVTPLIVRDVLIGTHELRVVKVGSGEAILNTQLVESEITEVNVDLNQAFFNLLPEERARLTESLQKERGQEEEQKRAREQVLKVAHSIVQNMVEIVGGSFVMGCTSDQRRRCDPDERPLKRAFVSPFSMLKFEVSQAEYQTIMGVNPSYLKCQDCPVTNVSWNDAKRFIDELNKLTGKRFDLPTEEEWEYAARGGESAIPSLFSGGDRPDEVAVFRSLQPAKRATKKPNELGLYDLSGNVWEWCSTSYLDKSKQGRKVMNPAWNSRSKVLRGGCFESEVDHIRTANRNFADIDARATGIGFRLVLRD
jgi:formylglycine-generating enzyme required for sulfatase activity